MGVDKKRYPDRAGGVNPRVPLGVAAQRARPPYGTSPDSIILVKSKW